MVFETLYYSTVNGNCPVKEFLDGLNYKIQQKFFARQDRLLAAYGEKLPPPHIEHLDDGIWEFKINLGNLEYRFLFFRITHHVVYVHAFEKKTQKVSRHEIELAMTRRRDFCEQLERGEIEL